MKPAKNKIRKLALRPETVAVLTPRQLTQIVGGGFAGEGGSSSSCETFPPCPDDHEGR